MFFICLNLKLKLLHRQKGHSQIVDYLLLHGALDNSNGSASRAQQQGIFKDPY
jgi:hypothetical protein